MAKELIVNYYEDHSMYFDGLENLVLHLHLHFDQLFIQHGSLCYLGGFGQEDFIGAISKNRHGSRFHGDLITHYYEVLMIESSVFKIIVYTYRSILLYAM